MFPVKQTVLSHDIAFQSHNMPAGTRRKWAGRSRFPGTVAKSRPEIGAQGRNVGLALEEPFRAFRAGHPPDAMT